MASDTLIPIPAAIPRRQPGRPVTPAAVGAPSAVVSPRSVTAADDSLDAVHPPQQAFVDRPAAPPGATSRVDAGPCMIRRYPVGGHLPRRKARRGCAAPFGGRQL